MNRHRDGRLGGSNGGPLGDPAQFSFSAPDTDGDDQDVNVFPGAPQLCDGINHHFGDPDWPIAPIDETSGNSGFFDPTSAG